MGNGREQDSETRVDTQKNPAGFLGKPTLKTQQKTRQKTHPKFNSVSYLVT